MEILARRSLRPTSHSSTAQTIAEGGQGGVFDALETDRKVSPRTLAAGTATVGPPSPGRRRLRPGHPTWLSTTESDAAVGKT
jgi:hypothetical protein